MHSNNILEEFVTGYIWCKNCGYRYAKEFNSCVLKQINNIDEYGYKQILDGDTEKCLRCEDDSEIDEPEDEENVIIEFPPSDDDMIKYQYDFIFECDDWVEFYEEDEDDTEIVELFKDKVENGYYLEDVFDEEVE